MDPAEVKFQLCLLRWKCHLFLASNSNIYIYVYGVKSELNLMRMLSVFLIQAMMTPTTCGKHVAMLMDILR